MTLDLNDNKFNLIDLYNQEYFNISVSFKNSDIGSMKTMFVNKKIMDRLILGTIFCKSQFKTILSNPIRIRTFVSGLVAEVDFSRVDNALLWMEI